MENTYCGKNCDFCITHTEGKCVGCKPKVHVPIRNAVYIAGLNDISPDKLLPGATVPEEEKVVEDVEGVRFSDYCKIAQCCRNNNYEGCNECQKTFACEAYSKKGIMNTIIESKMEAWGMVDHGLKNAIPYLYILLFCLLTEFIFPLTSVYSSISIIFVLISGFITCARAYAFYRLRSFNTNFLALTALTVAYILSVLFERFLGAVDYGWIGSILMTACALIQLASSILVYKMSFDAYAELVSPVDHVLESRWSKLWRLTIIFYIIAFVAGLLSMKGMGLSAFILAFAIASAILNIISFILMLATIKVCKND